MNKSLKMESGIKTSTGPNLSLEFQRKPESFRCLRERLHFAKIIRS